MGIDPRIFGPSFWGALHLACYGAENPDKVREFIALYPYVLPCIGCRTHFAKVLEEFPVPETSVPMELFEWSVFVHNIVNERLGKPTITNDEALMEWIGNKIMEFEMEAQPKQSGIPMWPFAILAILILIIIFVKFRK